MLMQTAARTAEPFFTNDGYGLVKLVSFALTILGPVMVLVYRLTFNQARAEMRDLKKDLNGYGERLNTMTLEQKGLFTEISAMNKTVQAIAIDVARVEEQLRLLPHNQKAST